MKKILRYTPMIIMLCASIYVPVIIHYQWHIIGTTPDIEQKLILFFISMACLMASYGYYLGITGKELNKQVDE
jgi:hypothetical protein